MLQFIFLKLREVQENVVHVIIQHTTDHKRDGDSRKYMTSALGDKVRQIFPMFQFYTKIIFFAFTAFKHLCELAVRKNQLAAQTVIFLQCLITFFYVVWLSSVSINLHIVHVYTYFELKFLSYSEEHSHWREQNSHGKNSTLTGFIRCTYIVPFSRQVFLFFERNRFRPFNGLLKI